jgi:hypothetical protein
LLRIALLLFAFILILMILRYYVPPRRRGNVVLGRIIGLVVGAVFANFYAVAYDAVYRPRNLNFLLIIFIVGVIGNAVVAGKIFEYHEPKKGVEPLGRYPSKQRGSDTARRGGTLR